MSKEKPEAAIDVVAHAKRQAELVADLLATARRLSPGPTAAEIVAGAEPVECPNCDRSVGFVCEFCDAAMTVSAAASYIRTMGPLMLRPVPTVVVIDRPDPDRPILPEARVFTIGATAPVNLIMVDVDAETQVNHVTITEDEVWSIDRIEENVAYFTQKPTKKED